MDPEVSECDEWCARHCGHGMSYERGLSLSIVWRLGLVFLESVRLYASLVERLCELSEYLLHWSVREF